VKGLGSMDRYTKSMDGYTQIDDVPRGHSDDGYTAFNCVPWASRRERIQVPTAADPLGSQGQGQESNL